MCFAYSFFGLYMIYYLIKIDLPINVGEILISCSTKAFLVFLFYYFRNFFDKTKKRNILHGLRATKIANIGSY